MKDTSKYFVKFLIFFVLAVGLFLLFQFGGLGKLKSSGPANILSSLEQEATTTSSPVENILVQGPEEKQTDQSQQNINGLKIEILKQGQGPEAKNGDKVLVHYTGALVNGTKFDSSIDRGQPFSFSLGAGEVIRG